MSRVNLPDVPVCVQADISSSCRYYAIVHPLKAQYLCTISKAKKTVLLAWVSAFLLGVPVLFVQVRDSLLDGILSCCVGEDVHSLILPARYRDNHSFILAAGGGGVDRHIISSLPGLPHRHNLQYMLIGFPYLRRQQVCQKASICSILYNWVEQYYCSLSYWV